MTSVIQIPKIVIPKDASLEKVIRENLPVNQEFGEYLFRYFPTHIWFGEDYSGSVARLEETGTDRYKNEIMTCSENLEIMCKLGLKPRNVIFGVDGFTNFLYCEKSYPDRSIAVYDITKLQSPSDKHHAIHMYKAKEGYTFLDALKAIFIREEK